MGRRDERRAAIAVGVVQAGLAGREDQFQDFVAAFRPGVEERRVLDVVLGVDVGAGLDQRSRDLRRGLRAWQGEAPCACLSVACFQVGLAGDKGAHLGERRQRVQRQEASPPFLFLST